MTESLPQISEELPLQAASPGSGEELLIVFVCRKLRLQHEILGARGEAAARLDAGLPHATAKPGLLNNFSLSVARILFADAKTLERRMADLQVDGLEACELCAVQVAGTVGDGIDRLVGCAVPLDDSLQGGGPKPGCFRRRTLGRFEWTQSGGAWGPQAHRQIPKTLP